MHNSIYIRFKNRQNKYTLTEFCTEVYLWQRFQALGWQNYWQGHKGGSGMLILLYILIWWKSHLCSLCRTYQAIFMIYEHRHSLSYDGSTYNFLILQRYESNTHSEETILQTLNFALYPAQHYVVQYSLVILGGSSEPKLPVSHRITRVIANTHTAILYPYIHTAFHFQYSTQ